MELQWNSTSLLPIDLISQIFLRLPEKSVVRFRCVSKLWLSITTDPYFINLFKTRNPRPSLLLCYKEDDELVFSSIPQHTFTLDQNSSKSYSSSQPIYNLYRMKFPHFSHFFPPTESVNGLICFQDSTTPIVWNPSTREFLTLPKPDESGKGITIFLGYDAIEGKHKVVAKLSGRLNGVCRVLTLGSAQESWRTVKTKHKHRTDELYSVGKCINGVIYYLAYIHRPYDWIIVRFDVRSEKFGVIHLPSYIHVRKLITYKGRLAFVDKEDDTEKNGITLSILEDAYGDKWSSKHFPAPFTYYHQSSKSQFRLKDFTHGGEFIYESSFSSTSHKSLYVLYFDPMRNSFRRLGFKGIADDEKRQYVLHIFPNHFENQMSL